MKFVARPADTSISNWRSGTRGRIWPTEMLANSHVPRKHLHRMIANRIRIACCCGHALSSHSLESRLTEAIASTQSSIRSARSGITLVRAVLAAIFPHLIRAAIIHLCANLIGHTNASLSHVASLAEATGRACLRGIRCCAWTQFRSP